MFSSRVMMPPPVATTQGVDSQARRSAAVSQTRKPASPEAAKISGIVRPSCASIASSRSVNGQESSAASRRPTVLLPQPIMPIRKMCLSMAYPFAARYAPSRRQFSQSLESDSISTRRLSSLTLPVRST